MVSWPELVCGYALAQISEDCSERVGLQYAVVGDVDYGGCATVGLMVESSEVSEGDLLHGGEFG